jgi:PAS domain S-box-containing protein
MLKESEERYRGLINNITDIIYELRINGKCTYVSNQLFEISGFYPDEMIGQNVFNYLHPDDFLNIAEKVKEAFNTGTRISADFRLKHKKGYYVPVSSSFNLIDTNGDVRLIGVIRDNTEQKKAEDAFLKEKEFTEIAINAQRDTFFIFEPFTGKAVRWNQAFRENSGFSDEEISIIEAPYSYYNENDLKRAALAIEKISTEGEALIEMSLITKDGNEIPFEYLGSSINDDEGNLKYIVVIGRDITERKQADEALRESERSLKMAQTVAHIGHWKLNPLTMEISGSDELFDIFGLNHDEATLDAFTEVVHPDDREYDLYHINRGMEYGENWDIEHRLITKDGIEKWIHAIGEVIKDDKGNVLMLLGTVQDITDLKNAEQNIKESEEKFRLLFEAIADPIHVIDADLKIIYMNPAFEEWLKSYNLYFDVIGKNPVEAWPHIGEEVNEEYKKVFETKKIHIKEDWTHINDIDIFTEARKIPIIKSGKVIQIITIVRDFSDRKKAELELIKLNNLKSELLRRTSHELKTPLVSIKGFSDLLLQVHRGKLDAFVISILNEIKQGCLRLENLIADILKTSELESGIIQLRKSEEDLSFLIRLCVNEIKGLSILRNHRINLEIPESLETMFEKEQVHQVVSNLLNNAVKYTPPGGLIEIKSEIKNEFIITSIKDNGIGISDEEKERIFKQFGKVERYGQGLDIISEGSGLGLFISKKIIELHGGKIWVESEGKHKGSTFYFSLPLVKNS